MRTFRHVILKVAIISNVQNVHFQHRHRPTDDASTRRLRGPQQIGPANKTHLLRHKQHFFKVINQ